jgi:hypothetical protein
MQYQVDVTEDDPYHRRNTMSESPQQRKQSWFSQLSEDWLAVIVGLALVILTWVGVITEVPWPLLGLLK